jgi:hypothetical protein
MDYGAAVLAGPARISHANRPSGLQISVVVRQQLYADSASPDADGCPFVSYGTGSIMKVPAPERGAAISEPQSQVDAP